MNKSPVSALKRSDSADKILIYPDPLLTLKSEPVEVIGEEVKTLAEQMTMLMKSAPGTGIAAPQVGVLQRVIVIDLSCGEGTSDDDIVTMVNPHILETEGTIIDEEGCLSIPNIYADIERPSKVKVKFQNLEGEEEEITTEDRVARCVMHEMEHLDGKLFWEHLGPFRRNILKLKFGRIQRGFR
ncbi:Peptide deformylase [hydrothermal vent metagenome]|uniref:Peptide deformylase n=1 Tax=hydrothermal vent metagenome TaxID=652676 RepID=A0A3B1B9V6_9ZZZZ